MMMTSKKRDRPDDNGHSDIPDHLLIIGDLPDSIDDSDGRIDSALLPSDIFHDDEGGYLEGLSTLPTLPIIQRAKGEKRSKSYENVIPNVNYNLINDRLVGTLHMPVQIPKMGKDKKDTRTKCGICCAKITIKCSHCGVGMCIADRDGRNCWREFHTREVLEYSLPKLQALEKNQKLTDRNHSVERIRTVHSDIMTDMLGQSSSSLHNHPSSNINIGNVNDSLVI